MQKIYREICKAGVYLKFPGVCERPPGSSIHRERLQSDTVDGGGLRRGRAFDYLGNKFSKPITVTVKGKTYKLNNPNDLWEIPPAHRGLVMEEILANSDYKDWWHCGTERRGFFPNYEFQNGNTAVSVKTLDLNAPSYTSGNAGTNKVIKYIDDLTNANVTAGVPIEEKVLDIRIPYNTKIG